MTSSGVSQHTRWLGQLLDGKYLLVRLLGAGAMGAVFEGRSLRADTPSGGMPPGSGAPNGTVGDPGRVDRTLEGAGIAPVAANGGGGSNFAVKLVRGELLASVEAAARFQREAQVQQQLSSPHIVPVVEFGRDAASGAQYLVMPLLDGYDVASLLERVGPLNPLLAARLMGQAARGCAVAHQSGVIHRDIKPSNLFLHHEGNGNVVLRVGDFGVAKRIEMYDDSHLTRTGSSLGSPLYMSPEQVFSAKHVDERSDVWGLGATLYEMLSGISPHGDARSMSELMVRITTRNPPPLQDRSPWVPPVLASIVHRALCRDPSRRHANAREFALELDRFAGGDCGLRAHDLSAHSAGYAAEGGLLGVAPRADLSALLLPDGEMAGGEAVGAVEDPLIRSGVAGKYQIVRLLGRGGMGAVYEAETLAGERVALKVMLAKPEGQDARRRFAGEIRAAMALHGDHVVRLLDAGTDRDRDLPFLVMELLRGTDLGTVFRRLGPLSPAVMVRLARQAALGLAAAHAAGVIHRDVKPSNLFLSVQRGRPDVVLKVCDFGAAKQESPDPSGREGLTQTGALLGSPLYMSPEQADNAKSVDARTDIWSLGICLYEGLAGRTPWEDCDTFGKIIVAVCTRPVTWLQDVAPWIEPELAELVHSLLERPLDRRIPSMQQVISCLDRAVEGRFDVLREELRGVDLTTRTRRAPHSVRPSQPASPRGVPLRRLPPVLGDTTASAAGLVTGPRGTPRRSTLPFWLKAGALGLAGAGLGITVLRGAPWHTPAALPEARSPASAPGTAEPRPAPAQHLLTPSQPLSSVEAVSAGGSPSSKPPMLSNPASLTPRPLPVASARRPGSGVLSAATGITVPRKTSADSAASAQPALPPGASRPRWGGRL